MVVRDDERLAVREMRRIATEHAALAQRFEHERILPCFR